MSGKHNGSSIQGGIFGTDNAPAPPQSGVRNRGASSIEGGIFGGPAPSAPPSTTNMTKSSLEGGIFGGYNHAEAPVSRPVSTPRVDVESMACAGAPIVRNEAFTFDDSSAPLQPLPSARRNNNASSQPGGIFGSEPIKHQPAVKRNNPNASSIEGGIFG